MDFSEMYWEVPEYWVKGGNKIWRAK
jgi:hypothetical protein